MDQENNSQNKVEGTGLDFITYLSDHEKQIIAIVQELRKIKVQLQALVTDVEKQIEAAQKL